MNKMNFKFPNETEKKHFGDISSVVKDFITKLLASNSSERLGKESGIEEIKTHPWLLDVDWVKLKNK